MDGKFTTRKYEIHRQVVTGLHFLRGGTPKIEVEYLPRDGHVAAARGAQFVGFLRGGTADGSTKGPSPVHLFIIGEHSSECTVD